MMELSTRREIALEGIENLKRATSIATNLKDYGSTQEIRDLAKALHFAAYGAQQIGLALTDRGRVNDL